MKTFYADEQKSHDPKMFLSSGAAQPNPEVPERIERLLAGAIAAGSEIVRPRNHGLRPIAAVHTPEYLEFLEGIFLRWQRIEGASPEVIPNIHPLARGGRYPASAVGQAGYHMADTACPISADTWNSACWSAWSAVEAADAVLAGDRAAYALCRPPGHHAFADVAGGFCFLNNSAIAAQHLLKDGKRVAILDVDLHHGNGTQGIFYGRADVLTVSLHADPVRFYPFFWGHADERGEGLGLGYNHNLPLPRKTGDTGFLEALTAAAKRISAYAPDVLVVALGLDAFEGDPFGGLSVSTPGFARIAAAIADLGLPTVIVQEGGYLCDELSDNLTSFLGGFANAGR
ncbi:histone deacetylase family protein [Pararhizobium sp.]|uniref:histone deacetylase family protein n=1 Tax=Pararhizobium sp. TaxID=1977563 RepID=UPI00271C6810|nr:histone deacetylase family protein [Pararhizobium sp.]MDO9414691.1 histone deacetylase family protein [Pararhizobium sp.]